MRDRPVTIKDLARELGVSIATVSRALSQDRAVAAQVAEKTRKRVRRRAEQMGYSPNVMARGMVTRKTASVGLLTYEIARETYARQADQILRAAEQHQYQILIAMTTHRERPKSLEEQARQIQQLLSRGVDGLLIHTRGVGGESARIRGAVRGRVPVVTIGHPARGLRGVVVDQRASFFEATEHLIRLGHQRIGFIGTDWNKNYPGSDRGKGYMRAMQEHGLSPKWIPGKTFPAQPTDRLGKRLGARFTALVCRGDSEAMVACRALHLAGLRMPEDVAVVGSGNVAASALLTPPLTSLAPPYEAVAQAAMELLLEQLQGRGDRRQITLRSQLIVRESCGGGPQGPCAL